MKFLIMIFSPASCHIQIVAEFLVGALYFSLLENIQSSSGLHAAPNSTGTRVKWPEHYVGLTSPISAKVMKEWSYNTSSTTTNAFMACIKGTSKVETSTPN